MINKKVIIESIILKNNLNKKFSNISVEYFNSLSENKKLHISLKYINEVNKIHNNILLNEFDVGKYINPGTVANFFTSSSLGSGVGQAMLEKIIGWGLQKYLGIPNGYFLKTIVNFLLDDPAMLIKSFTDCNVFTEKLIDAGVETFVQTKLQKNLFKDKGFGGFIGDALRNTTMEFIQNNEFKKNLMKTITPIACKFINDVKTKYFG